MSNTERKAIVALKADYVKVQIEDSLMFGKDEQLTGWIDLPIRAKVPSLETMQSRSEGQSVRARTPASFRVGHRANNARQWSLQVKKAVNDPDFAPIVKSSEKALNYSISSITPKLKNAMHHTNKAKISRMNELFRQKPMKLHESGLEKTIIIQSISPYDKLVTPRALSRQLHREKHVLNPQRIKLFEIFAGRKY